MAKCSGSIKMPAPLQGAIKVVKCQKRSGHSIFSMHRGWLYANVVVEWTHSTRLAARLRKKEHG